MRVGGLDIIDVDEDDDDEDDFDAPRVDWQKITDEQEAEYRHYSVDVLNKYEQAGILENDPINGITKLYNELYGLALAIFPQESKQSFKV